MTKNARWNLVVTKSTDDSLRQLLANQGPGRKGERSRFVEDAVRARIFEAEVDQLKADNSGYMLTAVEEAIDEAQG